MVYFRFHSRANVLFFLTLQGYVWKAQLCTRSIRMNKWCVTTLFLAQQIQIADIQETTYSLVDISVHDGDNLLVLCGLLLYSKPCVRYPDYRWQYCLSMLDGGNHSHIDGP